MKSGFGGTQMPRTCD